MISQLSIGLTFSILFYCIHLFSFGKAQNIPQSYDSSYLLKINKLQDLLLDLDGLDILLTASKQEPYVHVFDINTGKLTRPLIKFDSNVDNMFYNPLKLEVYFLMANKSLVVWGYRFDVFKLKKNFLIEENAVPKFVVYEFETNTLAFLYEQGSQSYIKMYEVESGSKSEFHVSKKITKLLALNKNLIMISSSDLNTGFYDIDNKILPVKETRLSTDQIVDLYVYNYTHFSLVSKDNTISIWKVGGTNDQAIIIYKANSFSNMVPFSNLNLMALLIDNQSGLNITNTDSNGDRLFDNLSFDLPVENMIGIKFRNLIITTHSDFSIRAWNPFKVNKFIEVNNFNQSGDTLSFITSNELSNTVITASNMGNISEWSLVTGKSKTIGFRMTAGVLDLKVFKGIAVVLFDNYFVETYNLSNRSTLFYKKANFSDYLTPLVTEESSGFSWIMKNDKGNSLFIQSTSLDKVPIELSEINIKAFDAVSSNLILLHNESSVFVIYNNNNLKDVWNKVNKVHNIKIFNDSIAVVVINNTNNFDICLLNISSAADQRLIECIATNHRLNVTFLIVDRDQDLIYTADKDTQLKIWEYKDKLKLVGGAELNIGCIGNMTFLKSRPRSFQFTLDNTTKNYKNKWYSANVEDFLIDILENKTPFVQNSVEYFKNEGVLMFISGENSASQINKTVEKNCLFLKRYPLCALSCNSKLEIWLITSKEVIFKNDTSSQYKISSLKHNMTKNGYTLVMVADDLFIIFIDIFFQKIVLKKVCDITPEKLAGPVQATFSSSETSIYYICQAKNLDYYQLQLYNLDTSQFSDFATSYLIYDTKELITDLVSHYNTKYVAALTHREAYLWDISNKSKISYVYVANSRFLEKISTNSNDNSYIIINSTKIAIWNAQTNLYFWIPLTNAKFTQLLSSENIELSLKQISLTEFSIASNNASFNIRLNMLGEGKTNPKWIINSIASTSWQISIFLKSKGYIFSINSGTLEKRNTNSGTLMSSLKLPSEQNFNISTNFLSKENILLYSLNSILVVNVDNLTITNVLEVPSGISQLSVDSKNKYVLIIDQAKNKNLYTQNESSSKLTLSNDSFYKTESDANYLKTESLPLLLQDFNLIYLYQGKFFNENIKTPQAGSTINSNFLLITSTSGSYSFTYDFDAFFLLNNGNVDYQPFSLNETLWKLYSSSENVQTDITGEEIINSKLKRDQIGVFTNNSAIPFIQNWELYFLLPSKQCKDNYMNNIETNVCRAGCTSPSLFSENEWSCVNSCTKFELNTVIEDGSTGCSSCQIRPLLCREKPSPPPPPQTPPNFWFLLILCLIPISIWIFYKKFTYQKERKKLEMRRLELVNDANILFSITTFNSSQKSSFVSENEEFFEEVIFDEDNNNNFKENLEKMEGENRKAFSDSFVIRKLDNNVVGSGRTSYRREKFNCNLKFLMEQNSKNMPFDYLCDIIKGTLVRLNNLFESGCSHGSISNQSILLNSSVPQSDSKVSIKFDSSKDELSQFKPTASEKEKAEDVKNCGEIFKEILDEYERRDRKLRNNKKFIKLKVEIIKLVNMKEANFNSWGGILEKIKEI